MADHNYFSNLIWQIADLLRGPYRPPQYERVMLPMTVLRRFDCVLAGSKAKVLAEHQKLRGGKIDGEALESGWIRLPANGFTAFPARLRKAQRRPGQYCQASCQLLQGILLKCPSYLRVL